jgi:predicted ATPase/DNA-binding SARP family transcriptional activator
LGLTPKALALFVYLAVTAAKGEPPPSRDQLADLLWSETNNQQARDNLRYLLPELRRPLGNYLCINTRTISFNRQAPAWLDVEQLRTALIPHPETIAPSALQAALDLYQGEFLAGFTVRNAPVFEAWVVRQREELHALVVQGAYILADRYGQQADYQSALAATQRLLQWESWHEAGHRLQMQLLAATGQRAAALAQYDRCRTILADELGVEPEAATVTLYTQIRDGAFDKVTSDKVTSDKVTSDKVTSTSSITLLPCHPVTLSPCHPAGTPEPPHNLPSQLTPFFGREMEIAQIGALLTDGRYRLVTLVGEGGSGKTRLALAVAQNLKFPDGVWFVALNALTTTRNLADQLAAAVAQAIGFSFSGQQPLFTQLLTYLRQKALLLLLDNAEHLLPEVADPLLQILQACPALTALVTSRHLFGLQAEFVWRVTGLAVPSQDDLPPTALLAYSSIALFVERAKRRAQDFTLTGANQAAIVAICRLVEGLPLAVELAAALTKEYSSAELYAALQQDYTILATRYLDLSPRHRSIQAMLDYSWHFLTPTEADALAACAIFAGGFTRAAALAVTDATPALLIKLVDQSLLQVHAGRFFLHELVRQYAAAKLAQTPERYHATAARHAAYTMQQLEELAATLLVEPNARTIFQAELDNVRLAWRWSAQQGDLTLLAQGVAGLESGCRLTGLYSEAIHLLAMALAATRQFLAAVPTHQLGNHLLARLLYRLAQFYRRTGQVESGECAAVEALALAWQLGDPALQGWAYHELARLAQARSDFAAMLALAAQGVTQARLTTSPHLKAECLSDVGIAHSLSTTPLAGIPYYHEARQQLQGGANRHLEGTLVSNLSFFSFAGHEYQTAYDFLQQALALRRLLSDEESTALVHLHLGDLGLSLGLYEKARQNYEQAATIMQALHVPYWESWLHISIGRLHHLRGDLASAHAACEVGRQLVTTHRLPMQEQWAQLNLGRILAEQGDYAAAHHYYRPLLTSPQSRHWAYRPADAYAALADLLRQTNDLAGAVTHIETALALLAQLGLAGANEPFTVYWTAVRVFTAANDARANEVLQTANQQLLKIAATLQDPVIRRSFLEDVAVNRALINAAQSADVTGTS